MILKRVHKRLVERNKEVEAWFFDNSKDLKFPLYSSFDMRNSGFKVAPVDANLFPAGFNNICDQDKDFSKSVMKDYLEKKYPSLERITLISESHTKNVYYWDNIESLHSLFVKVCKKKIKSS